VGWHVCAQECNVLASDIVCDICHREGVQKNQITLHSDNGGPMKGATMLGTLQTLGVAPSPSRPSASNDNPYSESLFKTLHYRPEHPVQPFTSPDVARTWFTELFEWYNTEHRHGSICYVTPDQRHAGEDSKLLSARAVACESARTKNPRRRTRTTRNWSPIQRAHLNPDDDKPTPKASRKKIRQRKKVPSLPQICPTPHWI